MNVILVDENDQQIGIMDKMQAHEKGLLHRAFSIFIVNSKNEMLLQKRPASKYHSPNLWTNACCSHPGPDETTLVAAGKRLLEEMGFNCDIKEITSFTYHTSFDNGLTEHEFDHVFLGIYDGSIFLNPEEASDYIWLNFEEIDKALITRKETFSFWFQIAYPLVKKTLAINAG